MMLQLVCVTKFIIPMFNALELFYYFVFKIHKKSVDLAYLISPDESQSSNPTNNWVVVGMNAISYQ